jgi:hypothetical protein
MSKSETRLPKEGRFDAATEAHAEDINVSKNGTIAP